MVESMIDKQRGLWIYPDGREVIQKGREGNILRELRWIKAWKDSKGVCCLCALPCTPYNASLEHKTSKGSGGGKHDDRQENLGISHRNGNITKGSLSLERYLELPLAVRVRNCGGKPLPGK